MDKIVTTCLSILLGILIGYIFKESCFPEIRL